MTMLVNLTFFLLLLQSVSRAHFLHEDVNISYQIHFLKECRSTKDVFRRILGEDLRQCITECRVRSHCLGVSYRRRMKICELFATVWDEEGPSGAGCIYIFKSDISDIESPCGICPVGQACDTSTNSCVYKECPRVSLANGVVLGNLFSVGNAIRLECNRSYSDLSEIKKATCQENGTWSEFTNCTKEPRTCSDVKHCDPSYTDGEYWLNSDVLEGRKVKIYCSGMTTASPTEYISVDVENNYGFNAHKRIRDSVLTKYKKIRVDIQTMQIIRNDTAFSLPENSNFPYGVGRGCNCDNGCTPWKGYFKVSLEGTGLKFYNEVEWKAYGWNQGMSHFQRNSDNTVISANCGGYCGHCRPNSSLILTYNQNDVVPDSSAVHPVCG